MLSVLILEDNDDIRTIVSAFLDSCGILCLEASSTLGALDVLSRNSDVCAAILDLVVPGGDVDLVMSRCQRQGIPIMVVTGINTTVARELCPPGTPILVKPADLLQLVSVLRDIIREDSSEVTERFHTHNGHGLNLT